MVPNIEREWIAEETRRTPRPPTGPLLMLILLLAFVLWIVGGC
jgi:hypothetical protein